MEYRVDIGSPPNYEEGKDKAKIAFFDEPIQTEIYYDVFIEALEKVNVALSK